MKLKFNCLFCRYNMSSCAFFGHKDFDYTPYEESLRECIVNLIKNEGVTRFYSCGMGKFENMCARIVGQLRKKYPQVQNTLVLSYIPKENFELDIYFDDSVYLLDKKVPLRFATNHTNRKLVGKVDFIVTGVTRKYGSAKSACDYAKRLRKPMINVVTGESEFFDSLLSEANMMKILAEHEERMRTDEEYRKTEEEKIKKLCKIVIPKIEENARKKHKKQRFR